MGFSFGFGGGKKTGMGFAARDVFDAVADPGNPAFVPWNNRVGGRHAAEQLAHDVYNLYTRGGTNAVELDALVLRTNQILASDNQKYQRASVRLQTFATRAQQRFYSNALKLRGNRAKSRAFVPGEGGSDFDRATDWVTNSSQTLGFGSVGRDSKAWKDLRNAIERAATSRDPCEMTTLEYLHAATGKLSADARVGTADEDFYGSSAYGMHFLPNVFRTARGLRGANDPFAFNSNATDLAVFLLIGCILAHPFGDGNGRSSRALYAVTQLSFGCRFKPAAHDWVQNQLHNRSINQVIYPNDPDFLDLNTSSVPRRQGGHGRQPRFEVVDLAPPAAETARGGKFSLFKRNKRKKRTYDVSDIGSPN